jgi:hypothetical protein
LTTPADAPTQYALTSVYTNGHIGGTAGPALITADPVLAAQFFLDHDRADELDVMIRTATTDGDLTPRHPGEVVRAARRHLDDDTIDDPWHTHGVAGARALLERAQAGWLKDRLIYKDDPYPLYDTPTEHGWERAGQLWAATFGDVPSPAVLARLRAAHPGADSGAVRLMAAASVVTRALRQARGPARSDTREQLADNFATLFYAWEASQTPAARAAIRRYLERLAELDPATAIPPATLPPERREQWRRAVLDYQRDQVVRAPHIRRELAHYTQALLDAPATTQDTPPQAAEPAGVAAQLPAAPASDEHAALAWRHASPHARQGAAWDDQILVQAHAYVADATRRTELQERVADPGTTVPATEIARETMQRHVVLGHLLALSEAEQAAHKLRPLVHDNKARNVAEQAREDALNAGKKPVEAEKAAQDAYVTHVEARERALDEALQARRLMVRAIAAQQSPPQQGRPLLNSLARQLDRLIIALPEQANTAYLARVREAADLRRKAQGPQHIGTPYVTTEDVDQAVARSHAAYQRWDELLTHDVPAMNAALRALRRVIAQQGTPPEPRDGADVLQAHQQTLTDRLHAETASPAPAATAAPARPGAQAAAARAQQVTHRPTTPAQRGLR